MADFLPLILCLLAGACAGAFFFEGLWRTVSRAVVSPRPAMLFVFSFVFRAALLLVLLCLVSRGNAFRLAACMAGFLLGRALILRLHRGGKHVAN
jgi:F1F0 ATPase subunit 2